MSTADVGYVVLLLLAAIGVTCVITAFAFLGLLVQHAREQRRGRSS